MNISISASFKSLFPELKIGIMTCKVKNSPTSDKLWNEMLTECEVIKQTFKLEDINKRPAIFATRQAYKMLGKDPNRYRPSAEALCRRIMRDIPVYRVDTLVDIINIVSIRSGISIGGFDADKICGDLVLDAGKETDIFEAIGRGILNVTGLPLYRDEKGGIGTPTSDNERTKLSESTTNLLLIFNAYSADSNINEAMIHMQNLLTEYAGSANINSVIK